MPSLGLGLGLHKSGVRSWITPIIPTDIAGLELWLTSDSVVDSGSYASQLTDLSGKDRHATQGTSGKRPQIVAASLNGHNKLIFDGTDDRLLTGSFTVSNPYTLIMVAKKRSVRAGAAMAGTTAAPATAFFWSQTNKIQHYSGATTELEAAISTDLSLWMAINKAAAVAYYRNGIVVSKTLATSTAITTGITVGGYVDADSVVDPIDFYELILYSGSLTAIQQAGIIDYLQTKYATNFGIQTDWYKGLKDRYDGVFENCVIHTTEADYVDRSQFANFSFNTSDSQIAIDVKDTFLSNDLSNIAIFENDVLLKAVATIGSGESKVIKLSAGTKKVTIVESQQGTGISPLPYPTRGSFIQKIYAKNFSKVTQSTIGDKIVFFGDSISGGGNYVSIGQDDAYSRLFKTIGGVNTSVMAYGGARLQIEAANATLSAALVAKLITLVQGNTGRKIIVIAIGTNDFGNSIASATFLTWYADVMDRIHTADADVEIFCLSPLVRSDDAALLDAYRSGIDGLCTARSAYATYIEGKTILALPGDFGADGLHPTVAAQLKLYEAIKPIIFP
jgi:lysophospholipase L1-like esterase